MTGLATVITIVLASGGFAWLALGAFRLLLGSGPRVFAVARSVVDEGCRKRVASFVFLVAIVYLGVLAGMLDPRDPLAFRIQNLITYGLGGVVALGLLLTTIVGCGSLAAEFEEKQIYTVATKPIRRGSLLLGKWVGVMVLNAVLLTVSGVELYALAEAQVRTCEDPGEIERARRTVLIAHRSIEPSDDGDPNLVRTFEGYLPVYAERNPARFRALGEEEFRRYAWDRFREEWKRVPAGRTHTYRFDGLEPGDASLHLRGRMFPPPVGDQVILRIGVDEERLIEHVVPLSRTVAIPLGSRAAGPMTLRIHYPNGSSPAPLDLSEPHALEVVQPATNFVSNLARGLFVYAIKLGFVAALAVCGAGFLSFPVAALTVSLMTVIALSSDYLISSSLEPGGTLYSDLHELQAVGDSHSHSHGDGHTHSHAHAPDESFVERALIGIERAGLMLALKLRKFGEISPVGQIVEGRLVDRTTVSDALLWIGGVWTGSIALLGYLVFRRREIARVQV